MVCGTTSDAGKSQFVTGLCRLLARNGVRVAPFKAQNMANNSYVTSAGHEIGRAQALQAFAAGAEPEIAMNPILLKPSGERVSQVIVQGKPLGHLTALEYHEHKPQLFETVLASLRDLRLRFDVVICEGAGSPTEINLLSHDIVNLRVAQRADLPAIVIGDINPGGVFAALYGTVALLPDHLRSLVQGFVINKLRGDPALLLDGTSQLQAACGVPTLGVLPWIEGLLLDAEDSMSLDTKGAMGRSDSHETPVEALDIAVVRLPRIANFTDFDALAVEPGVHLRYVHHPAALGSPDLVIIPGSKATVSDLNWFRDVGFDRAIATIGASVLGICAGYQMLGETIDDPVESGAGVVTGLGWLGVATTFEPEKITRQTSATALGCRLQGYQIHHGRVRVTSTSTTPWLRVHANPVTDTNTAAADVEHEICNTRNGKWIGGTTVHGLFDSDDFRHAFLSQIAGYAGKTPVSSTVNFAAKRFDQIDRVANAIEEHVDIEALCQLIESGVPARSKVMV